jgi:hypothetical protein
MDREIDENTNTSDDTLARGAWLHAHGINTSRYRDGGGDHPAMRTLPAAFEAFAARQVARSR